jgi:hypothetical protein
VSDPFLTGLLERPLTPPDPAALAAATGGPMGPAAALPLTALDRLLDPAPLEVETGWCRLPDGTAQVAARTAMPGVSGAMVDWWFDWHADDPLRYRVWHPAAHRSNRIERPAHPGAKAHWGAVHHPVEDVGTGVQHVRIAFCAPSELGFGTDGLDDPRVATIVGGRVGLERAPLDHTVMVHVFLREGDGVVLRSRFWLAAAGRPRLPGPLAAAGAAVLNLPAVRRRSLPPGVAPALALHCVEEYANLAALLPELHARYAVARPEA